MSADQTKAVVVVTGAAGGIGLALARQALVTDPACRLVMTDVSAERLATAAEGLRGGRSDVVTMTCDLADPASVGALRDFARDLGPLRAVLHAAGIAPPISSDPAAIIDIDLLGTLRVLDAFEEVLTPGSVGVCLASLAGYRAFTRRQDALLDAPYAPDFLERATAVAQSYEQDALAAYSLAKRGVILLCRRRAAAWGSHGARLVSISPGLIADTAVGAGAMRLVAAEYPKQAAVGRAGRSEDIAKVAGFLLSPASDYLSGTDLLVDGGVLAHISTHADASARQAWNELS